MYLSRPTTDRTELYRRTSLFSVIFCRMPYKDCDEFGDECRIYELIKVRKFSSVLLQQIKKTVDT
jgi:hypothetical protein